MKFIATIWAMALTIIASAQVISPNGKVEWREKGKGFAVVYHDGNSECEVLDVPQVGILTKDGGGKELTLKSKMPVKAIKDSYTMIGGKRHECSNEANEITYVYTDNIGREQRLIVRAYNDGVAFRYAFEGLQHTRRVVNAGLDGELEHAEWETFPVFGLAIPKACEGVPSEILNPRNTWEDKAAYDVQLRKLAELFGKNVAKFHGLITEDILSAGPKA